MIDFNHNVPYSEFERVQQKGEQSDRSNLPGLSWNLPRPCHGIYADGVRLRTIGPFILP